jgi:hypothetical protein
MLDHVAASMTVAASVTLNADSRGRERIASLKFDECISADATLQCVFVKKHFGKFRDSATASLVYSNGIRSLPRESAFNVIDAATVIDAANKNRI